MLRSAYDLSRSALLASRNCLFNTIDPPVIVLTYHRVATLMADPQLLSVTPENFRAHMLFLKNNYPVLRLEDDWERVKELSVVITFDDGYADNALDALPVLEEVGVPATFFVTTGYIGTRQEYWWDELERLILGDWPFPGSFELQCGSFEREWPTATASERYVLYKDLQPLMKTVDHSTREGWIQQLRSWAHAGNVGRDTHRPMTIDELMLLDRSSLITIGAHTVSHSALSALSHMQQNNEILYSRVQLENWLGHKITLFSYPFGTKNDYTSESVSLCRQAGYFRAISNFPGQVHRWTDPYQIPRHLVRNWTDDVFQRKLREFSYI